MSRRTAWNTAGWNHCGRVPGRQPLLLAAVLTPRRDQKVDHAGFEKNLRHQVSAGLDGILVAGTTGENSRLAIAERDALIQTTTSTVPVDALIISGIKGTTPETVAADSERVRALGADLVLVPPPFSPTGQRDEANLAAYIDHVVRLSSLPVLFYHPPVFRQAPLSTACISEVRAVPGLAGVKDSLGDAAVLDAWLSARSHHFAVFVGSARLFRDTAKPVTGGILALASACPQRWMDFVAKRSAGSTADDTAAELEEPILALESGGLLALKQMHEEKGLCGGE